jgi:F0F1-type ATP synthase membrane subunit b/b'
MSEKIADAKRQAQEIVQTAAEEGRGEAERVRQEALRQADERTQAEIDGKTDAMEKLVTRISTLILGTEYEMDGQ